jgi:hypothetical protein
MAVVMLAAAAATREVVVLAAPLSGRRSTAPRPTPSV